MDELTLAVLKAEVAEDCRVLTETARLARARIGDASDTELEACAFQLARLYNIVEQIPLLDAAQRVATLAPAACEKFFSQIPAS